MDAADDTTRTGFLVAARIAAEGVGFPVPIAQSLTAAIREMESNIHEHSQLAETGILAFQAAGTAFEFVVADCGIGVLSTLQESPDFPNLIDHGKALHLTLQEGTSRYGRNAHRGMGFRDLFLGLASLNADLRFRSGDHALTISGPHPELKVAQLAQKPSYQGFLASVRCELPRASHIAEVGKILSWSGFRPQHRKTVVIPPGSRKLVLGLQVDGDMPRLTREFKDRLRQHLCYLEKFGAVEHAKARGFETIWGMKAHIRGLIDFANMVEPQCAVVLLKRFELIDWPV